MNGVRAIDWAMLVIEALVLVLIAIDFVIPKFAKRKHRRRRAVLISLMGEGQQLLASVPDNREKRVADAPGWTKNVDAWITQTGNQLQGYSAEALAAFNQETHSPKVEDPNIAHNAEKHHWKLLDKLNNLRSIMEAPEVYY